MTLARIIGFSLAYNREPPRPKWLYPWLNETLIERDGWYLRLWGHGELPTDNPVEIGDIDCRGLMIELGENAAIANDLGGYMPVFYANGMASTDEQCIVADRELDEGGVLSFLLTNTLLAGKTIWRDIKWLPGNSVLTLTRDGQHHTRPQEPLQA